MRTLYLRNVPDEVVERLERRAKEESTSVNALAVRELTEVSRRYNNAALPRLRDHDTRRARPPIRLAGRV